MLIFRGQAAREWMFLETKLYVLLGVWHKMEVKGKHTTKACKLPQAKFQPLRTTVELQTN
jgi:hypothetical protein